MPLALPNLDDRRWSDLIDEGRALISRYSSVWTDFNVHDPGIMLIELFAWLAEASDYQLNQVPARHRWKFLSLIGYRPHGPVPSRAVITFGALSPGTSIDLAAGVEFDSGAVRFATTRGIHLEPVTISALQVDDGSGKLRSFSRDLKDGLPIYALGRIPQVGSALYLGFDDLPSAVPVALAFWFGGPGNDARERARIEREAECEREACRHLIPGAPCPGAPAAPPAPVWHPPKHHSARIVWEVFTGTGWTALTAITAPQRPMTGETADDTRSLTLDGIVEINPPASIAKTALGAEPAAVFYLRARLASGAFDAPVVLDDVRPNSVYARQHIVLARSFSIAAGTVVGGVAPAPGNTARFQFQMNSQGIVTALSFIPGSPAAIPGFTLLDYTAPTAGVPGSITVEAVVLGVGSGAPNQKLILPDPPVEAESVRVYTHDGVSWMQYHRREDFDAAIRDSLVFTLDPVAGIVTSGSGERGEVFPYGTLIVAAARNTLGSVGNVAAKTITSLAKSPANSTLLAPLSPADLARLKTAPSNPYAAAGGRDEETLDETVARAAELLHAHERIQALADAHQQDTLDQIPRTQVVAIPAPTNAVNSLDIERMALTVPGTRVARARAWHNTSHTFPCLDAPGVVTLVIIPAMPVPMPQPSTGLKSAVFRDLDLRRMICTRLEVVGPSYVVVTVEAQVAVLIGADPNPTRQAVIATLNNFLDPLIGGPLGLGWPFGRSVYRAEILEKIAEVQGVDYVTNLRLVADSGQPQCGDLQICPTWLVAPGKHKIEVVS